MRALLIINPHATSTSGLRRDVIARALSSAIDLEVTETRYRGHAASLAAAAGSSGHDLVIALGGDGTVNEVVNGMLGPPGAGGGPEAGSAAGGGAGIPAFATIPGGNANVFSRALGMPADPIDATGQILSAITAGKSRGIGLGLAGDRYFTFSAGLGIDGEVVRAIEGLRATGRKASDLLYMWTTFRQYYLVTDRRQPALTCERNGEPPEENLFLGVVSNTAPWTYLGQRPVNPNPLAHFDTGLDLFALRKMRTVSTMNVIRQMLARRNEPPKSRQVLSLHDQAELTLRSARPIALQVDGEYMGERECVSFRAVPDALRVYA